MGKTVSAIVITKNEADRIDRCLNALAWADELIVVDNGSSDDTVERAKKHKANVIFAKGHDFAHLRNKGKEASHCDWLLYVDADEIVTGDLAKEIQAVMKSKSQIAGYALTRKNYYLGREWPYKESIVRFMRKEALIGWDGRLHETAKIHGNIGKLKHSLIHHTHRSLEEMVAKTNEWSDIEAQLRLDARHPTVAWWRLLRVMCTAFCDSFFRQGGWKAGIVGWIESMYQAFSMFITYAKLWEKQQGNKLTK